MNLDLATVRDDLAYLRRRQEQALRAPFEGRLGVESAWRAAMESRRLLIEELEAREAELLRLDEGTAA